MYKIDYYIDPIHKVVYFLIAKVNHSIICNDKLTLYLGQNTYFLIKKCAKRKMTNICKHLVMILR